MRLIVILSFTTDTKIPLNLSGIFNELADKYDYKIKRLKSSSSTNFSKWSST
jgi:hypothetical protein